ncbi:MAG: chromate transporter [Eubacterium sp.]|jgi:chromate transporter|nr:chromate transporter [Eubacterium sp.]
MIYIKLIYEFFKIGVFSIGGGLSTIPFLYRLSEKYDWYTLAELADMIAVSEATPGPIGVNIATYAGFKAGGVLGGISATLSLILPSVIIIIVVSHFLNKFKDSRPVSNVLYGIRPASAGLVAGAVYALLTMTVYSKANGFSPISIALYAIFTIFCFYTRNKKIHPIAIIAIGAAVGIISENIFGSAY